MSQTNENIPQKNIVDNPSVIFGWVRYPVGSSFGPRRQMDVQLFLLLEGSVRIRLNGQPVSLRPDECIVLVPGVEERFQFSREEETVHSWCSLQPEILTESQRASVSQEPGVQPTPAGLAGLIEAGVRLRHLSGTQPDTLLHLARCIYSMVLGAGQMKGREGRLPETILRAIHFLEARFEREDLRCKDLADAAGVSPQHLSRLFRQHLGCTPMNYLWEVRVREGMDALRSTGLNVSEIAYRCGFRNPYHFSRKFHERAGCPPTVYRRRSQQIGDSGT